MTHISAQKGHGIRIDDLTEFLKENNLEIPHKLSELKQGSGKVHSFYLDPATLDTHTGVLRIRDVGVSLNSKVGSMRRSGMRVFVGNGELHVKLSSRDSPYALACDGNSSRVEETVIVDSLSIFTPSTDYGYQSSDF